MATANPGLVQIAEGVWCDTAPVRNLGMHLTGTMTVLQLGNGSLLLHSPIPLTPERQAAVDALGKVDHLYAPNTYHHLSIGDWADAYPSARLHAPPGLAAKRPDLRIDRLHTAAPEPAFEGVIDELPIEGFLLEESVLFYRPSRTLVVADLVHNLGRPEHLWTRIYSGAMGFYDRVALSRMIRWIGFYDRGAARRSFDAVMACPFDRVVLGHGAPLLTGAREALAQAYTWLPPARPEPNRPRALPGRKSLGLGAGGQWCG
jgi:hypothetical protein